jgi:F-type H+-transporting ATPase subunit delta
MSDAAVADRYARAIFELGQETGQLQALSEQIRNVANLYKGSSELQSVLGNPVLEEGARNSLLSALGTRLGLSAQALNAVKLLAQRRRLSVLPQIAKRLSELADEKSGVLRVSVRSARPLAEDYFQRLVREIESATGRRVVLDKSVDPTLIAGVLTQIGDNTIDGTLVGRLQDYERKLLGAG